MTDAALNDGFEEAAPLFVEAAERGQPIDLETLFRRHPQCARELRAFIKDISFLPEIKSAWPSNDATADETAVLHPVHVALTCESGFTEIEGYRIIEVLGCGGQGMVYKAEQFGTKRLVALKFLAGGARAPWPKRQRFRNEVELISRLKHPNIVAVHACGHYQGSEFFAMEYVEGVPLDVYIAGHTLKTTEAMELFLLIADAIRYAHQVGVLHRDLKPSNVLIDAQGRPHVLDFGLARAFGPDDPAAGGMMTQEGVFAGTWAWASPEQIRGQTSLIDVRTDVYGLGMLLYLTLTDSFPYPTEEGETWETIGRKVAELDPFEPRAIRLDLDEDAATIVLRCLAKDREARYPTVEALHADIKRYLAGEPIEARRDSAFYVLKKTVRRYRRLAIAAGVASVALLVFALVTLTLYARAQAARAEVEVKTGIDLNSRVRLGEHVNELNHVTNHLEAFIDAHPDDPAAIRYARGKNTASEAVFDGLDIDPQWFASGTVADWADNPAVIAWLAGHEARLNELQATLKDHRVVFGEPSLVEVTLPMVRKSDYFVEAHNAAQALAVHAYRQGRGGLHSVAVASLDGALLIALDLGDAPTFHPKLASVIVRDAIYDTVLTLLSQRPIDASLIPYLDWVSADPPLPGYGIALVAIRENLVKCIREGSTGRRPGEPGYVDLDRLNEYTSGMYRTLGLVNEDTRRLTKSVSPQKLLDALDSWIAQVEHLDDLNSPAIKHALQELYRYGKDEPGFPILGPFLSDKTPAFLYRRQIMAKQSALRLVVTLCRYHVEGGHWPQTLNDLSPLVPNDPALTLDPYTGDNFRYKLDHLDNEPVPMVYSINEDIVDNGGAPGSWGVPETDVVIWPVAAGARPGEQR